MGNKYIVRINDFDPKDERRTITTYEGEYDNLDDAQDDFDRLLDAGAEPVLILVDKEHCIECGGLIEYSSCAVSVDDGYICTRCEGLTDDNR